MAPNVVYFFINECVEKKEPQQVMVGNLFVALFQKKLLTQEDFSAGFNLLVEMLDDLVVDIPGIADILARLLTPLVVDGKASLGLVKDITNLASQARTAPKLLARFFRTLVAALGEEATKALVNQSGGFAAIASVPPAWFAEQGLEFLSS